MNNEVKRLMKRNDELTKICKVLLDHFKNAYLTDVDSIKTFKTDIKRWEATIRKATEGGTK